MNFPADAQRLLEAFKDPRVLRVMEIVLRDNAIRSDFEALRRSGAPVRDLVEQLSERYCLSEDHIRTIVYLKQHRL